MNLDLSEYMGAYIDGSRENLDTMDKMLLSLEQNPSNLEAIEEIFRAAHTLKGMSATMGFEKIAHLTHEMESILDKLRSHQIPVTTAVIDLIFETFDVLRTLVNDSIESTDSNIDLSELSAKLSSMAAGEGAEAAPATSAPATAAPGNAPAKVNNSIDLSDLGLSAFEFSSLEEAGDDGKNVVLLQVSLVSDCLLKGPRVFMILRTLDDLQCDIVKSNPEVKDLENEKFDRSFKMLLITDKTIDEIRYGIESISEIDTVDLNYVTGSEQEALSEEEMEAPPPPPVKTAPEAQKPAQQTVTQQLPSSAPPRAAAPQAASTRSTTPAAPRSTPVAPPSLPDEDDDFPSLVQAPATPQPAATEEEDEGKTKEVVELVQLVTFTMADETYALEIQQIEAIINLRPITRVPKAPPYIDGVINLRGEIVPVINTRHRLRLPLTERKASNQIIILSFEEEKVKAGFLVDSVQEVIRLTEASIEAPTRVSESVDIEYLRGIGKIDNKIIILLNAHRIVFGKQKED